MKAFILLLILIPEMIFAQGMTYKSLPSCDKNPVEISEASDDSVLAVSTLPKGLYLARSVIQSLEKSEGEKYVTYKNLVPAEKENNFFCYQGVAESAVKLQSFVPTVIDMTKEQKWGHAFWSYSISADKKAGALEANRSLIPTLDYKDKLIQQGFKVTQLQRSHKEFEIRLQRNVASWKETIILIYDQF